MTLASWDQTLRLNLTVPFFLARALVPGMRAKGGGAIINLASLQSLRAFADSAPYGASKGGILFEGERLDTAPRRTIARRIQPVFQDPYSSLNPRKTVGNIVCLYQLA